MDASDPNQFLGLPAVPLEKADAVILPVPLEKTVSYGTGTWRGPRAILDASCQVESFDEQTQVDFTERPRLHTLPLLLVDGELEEWIEAIEARAAGLREKFVVTLGGEHSLTLGAATGLAEDLGRLTIVQIDAHADLIDSLDGRRFSHGTVMRRLWEQGCRLVQIGVRSLSREEYELARADSRIETFFAHELPQRWDELLAALDALAGPVYLTLDVDGLDPGVIPSTGTPQPGGLSWWQTIEIIRRISLAQEARWIGADVVELVASPHPPGCDLAVARLASKLLAWWWKGLGHRAD